MTEPTFAALATAAYCPRQLYYRRRSDDWTVPPEATAIRELAFRYPELLEATDATLVEEPIAVPPDEWQRNLDRAATAVADFGAICHPVSTAHRVQGADAHGVIDKVLEAPAGVSLVSPGQPPPAGAWKPQRVRAVAAAEALAEESGVAVDHAYVEYPGYGVIRRVPLDRRRRAEYRRVLRTVRAMHGVPPRLRNRSKCGACEYRETCGVRTWSLRSLLG